MAATLAYTRPRPGEPAREASLVRSGMIVGLRLLVLPPLVVAGVRLAQPGNPIVARILAVEPDTLDDTAHRLQRALAADAVDDEHCGPLMRLV